MSYRGRPKVPTTLLHTLIVSRYGGILAFAEATGLERSTVSRCAKGDRVSQRVRAVVEAAFGASLERLQEPILKATAAIAEETGARA